jgi:hydrogenase maturation protease
VITVHQLQPELADVLRSVDRVIFIDAAREGVPGEVRCLPVEPHDADANLTHDLAPSTLLALAEKLYGAIPSSADHRCGERFDLHEGLSPAVEAAVPVAVAGLARVA